MALEDRYSLEKLDGFAVAMGWTLERMTAFAETIRNAQRLRNDAELLFKNDRHGSACALGILGFEEVGKALRMIWGETPAIQAADRALRGKIKSGGYRHIQKQVAAAALLTAATCRAAIFEECRALGFEHPRDVTNSDCAQLSRTASKRLSESAVGSDLAYTVLGITDRLKQASLYVDSDALEFVPMEFASEDSRWAIDQCRLALNLIADPELVSLARTVIVTNRRQ